MSLSMSISLLGSRYRSRPALITMLPMIGTSLRSSGLTVCLAASLLGVGGPKFQLGTPSLFFSSTSLGAVRRSSGNSQAPRSSGQRRSLASLHDVLLVAPLDIGDADSFHVNLDGIAERHFHAAVNCDLTVERFAR